jgi:signal transduction histidine kinase
VSACAAFAANAIPFMLNLSILGLALGLVWASFRTFQAPRRVARLAVTILGACSAVIIMRLSWSPATTIELCVSVVVAGLLLGRLEAGLLIAFYALVFVGGGVAIYFGWITLKLPNALDFGRNANWLRTGTVVVFVSLAGAWAMRRVVSGLDAAVTEEQTALRAALSESNLAEEARVKRYGSELELSNTQKLQTVAQLGRGFAHLFNNILTIVRSAIDDAKQATSHAELKLAAASVANAAALGATKTRDLLTLSRPHTDQFAGISVQRELTSCCQKAAGRLRDNINIVIGDVADGSVALSASQFEQLLTNLLLNAEQAMKTGGNVYISTALERVETLLESSVDFILPGTYLTVTVTDEGSGMSADVMQHACEPFFTTKGITEHEGLGLTLVQGILKRINGSLSLSSGPSGTKVVLYLPLTPTSACHEEFASSSTIAASSNVGEPNNTKHVAATTQEVATAEVSWQHVATRRLLVVATAFFTFGSALYCIQTPAQIRWIAVTLVPALLIMLVALFLRNAFVWFQSGSLVFAIFIVGATLLVNVTFMSPAAIALLVLSILLAAELLGGTATFFVALAAWIAFVVGGFVHSGQLGETLLPVLNPRHAENWIRMGVFFAPVLSIFSMAVLFVVATAQRQLERTTVALHQLKITQEQRGQETKAAISAETTSLRALQTGGTGKLTGMVAHDLNNSLQTMVGWAELLSELVDDPTIKNEALTGIEQATDYAEALIQQLQLGISERPPAMSIDVGEALSNMQPMLLTLLHRGGRTALELSSFLDSSCYVRILEPSLRRIALNLVGNARDAMTDVGRCTIKLSRQPPEVILSVKDDGCGMDERTLARVSDAFFTTKGERGTGLGLHSIKELMLVTHGRFEITSTVGQGTTVSLFWPLSDVPRVEPIQGVRSQSKRGKGRVLLVENEEQVRVVLARMLTANGYSVITAVDGDDATRYLGNEGFELLCTDAIMPGRPTIELVADFLARYPRCPVVVISGHLPSEFAPGLLDNPKVSYLSKPFTNKALLVEFERRLQT